MKGETDTIKKFIQILINLQGAEEATQQAREFYDTQSNGMQGAKKDAEDAAPKIEDFLKRWKYELMLVGGAVTAIYATIRYSSVAHTMMDLLGRSIGFVADVILIQLLPYLMVVVGWFIELGKALNNLPSGFKDMIAFAVVGAAALWGVHKALIATGIAAGTLGIVLGALAGVMIGIEIVLLLRNAGAFKALGDFVGDAKAALLNWLDDMSLAWDNFWIDRMNFFIELYNSTFARLPGMKESPLIKHLDQYDKYAQELEKHVREMGGGTGGRTDQGDTMGDTEGWGKIITQMREMGMTPQEYANFLREKNIALPKYEFVPPHAGWNEEDNAIKSFLSWGYDYKDEWWNKGSSAGGLPKMDSEKFEQILAKYYANEPATPTLSSPQGGTLAASPTSRGQEMSVTIQNATFNIDPNMAGNRSLMDQIAEMSNRTNAQQLKRTNFYG
jgi:hypothetical protein